MADFSDLLDSLPLAQLAARTGATEDEVRTAAATALPALLGGMQANAAHPSGEASLAEALSQHDNDLLDGGVDLDAVDPDDGAKITRHVFGDQTDAVVSRLGGGGSKDAGLVGKLLPLLAPIVLSYLAKQVGGTKGGVAGGVLGTVLSSVLSGALSGISPDTGKAPVPGGGILGELLGGLLGKGRR